MQTEIQTAPASNKLLWTGRVLSILSVLFILFDSVLHLLKPVPVVQAFTQLGLPLSLSITIGLIQLICLILYVVPRSAVLGAVLLTGYFGGAIAIQMRAGSSLYETTFPVIIGILFWTGLLLRDHRLRAIFPISS